MRTDYQFYTAHWSIDQLKQQLAVLESKLWINGSSTGEYLGRSKDEAKWLRIEAVVADHN